jgi:AcrR family transcriptional regulator
VLQQAILDATLDQLREVGYSGLTMEGVAAAAGTGKAALYHRWPNKDALVADALATVLPDPAELELGADSDPVQDIHKVLRCMRDAMNVTAGHAFQSVKQQAGGGEFLHLMIQQQVMDPCRERILDALERGRALGRLRAEAVNERVANVGPAMLIHYAVTVEPMVPDEYVAAIVDDVIRPLVAEN